MVDILKWLFGERGMDAHLTPTDDDHALLAPHLDAIARTELPIIAIDVKEATPSHAQQSALGGRPWWPAAKAYPLDKQGKPLYLLIQINFAETPALQPFPREGLLQFFIGGDDLYGCDFDNLHESQGFACVYHTDLAQPPLTDFADLEQNVEDAILPLEKPLQSRALSFALTRMPVDPTDYRFEKLLPEIAADQKLSEAYWEVRKAPALRLGGYPTFTQQDPRSYRDGAGYGDFTLLTADTTTGLMWGDSGAAQFFTNEDNLKRCDFSKVAYSWDCC